MAEDWTHEWIMNGRVRESAGECGRVRESAGECGEYGRVRESAESTGECGRVRESAGECGRVRRVHIEGKLMDSIIYAGIAKREGRN